MGEHDALAHARGAAGIQQRAHLVPLARIFNRILGILGNKIFKQLYPVGFGDVFHHGLFHQGEKLFLGKGKTGMDMAPDDGFELGFGLDFFHAGHQQGQGDDGPGVGIIELIGHFPFGIERVDLDGDGADAENGVIGDNHLGDVGQADRHLVPGFDAQPLQCPGKGVDHAFELAEGGAFPHVV
jgi:hypothetical protein